MSPRISIENRINRIHSYCQKISVYSNRSELAAEGESRYAFERLAFLIVQSSIDLVEAIIAMKELRKPETLSDTFEVIREAGIIKSELSERLVRMVGFRNILSHDYENISVDRMFREVLAGLVDIEELIASVKQTIGL